MAPTRTHPRTTSILFTESVVIYGHWAPMLTTGGERRVRRRGASDPRGLERHTRGRRGGAGRARLTVIIFLPDIVRADERRQPPHIPFEDALVHRVVCGATASICDDSNGVGAR